MKKETYQKHHIGRLLLMLALSVCIVTGSGVFTRAFAAVKVTKVKIDGVRYTAIKATDTTLYSGSYALGSDIVLNNSLDVSYIDDESDPTPTTIILNGYSLTIQEGSEDPVIVVSNGATLILKDKAGADGKVVAVYESVDVEDGYVILENADLSSSDAPAIRAENSEVSVTGDSTVSGCDSEEGAIYCGEAVKLSIEDTAAIKENRIAVSLETDTEITVGGSAKITGNSEAGLLCYEDQKIAVDSAKSGMLCEISVRGTGGAIHDAKLLFSESYKAYKNYFIGGDGRDVSSIVSGDAKNCIIVKALTCSGHKYTYSAEGYTIRALCSECGAESVVSLKNEAYYDENTGIYYVGDPDDELTIDDSLLDKYKVSLYPTLLYRTAASEEYGFTVPSDPGDYVVKLALLSEEGNAASILAQTDEFAFQKTCSQHEWEYVVDGNSICARCVNCGGTFATSSLSVNNFNLPEGSGEQVVLYECRGDEFEFDLSVSGVNLGLGNFKVLYGYTQEDGTVNYTLTAPTEEGDYLICLAVLKVATRPATAIVSTEPVSYSYRYHCWEYKRDGKYAFTASCDKCGGRASVSLDSSEILYASRQYANEDSGTFEGNVFCEQGWSEAKGIMPYHVYYRNPDDLENNTEELSLLGGSPADFYATIVLENDDEAGSVYMATYEKRFYYATLDLSDSASGIEYVEFSDSMMKKPSTIKNIDVRYYDKDSGKYVTVTTKKYYVESAEELYWVAENAESTATIVLTDDIVVNPIVVSDDGKSIYSASKTIYKWTGFGSSLSDAFKGTIDGNGYTIYGLYDTAGKNTSSLVGYGQACQIIDLSLTDSVFSGWFTGGLIGYVNTVGPEDSVVVKNCSVRHCSLAGTGKTGGLIGYATLKSETTGIYISDCVSDNYINGRYCGGIIGETGTYLETNYNYKGVDGFSIMLTNCVNLGNVYGSSAAGGIIGYVWGTHAFTTDIGYCRNLGRIESSTAAGGLVGSSYNNESLSIAHTLNLNNNINLGTIDCTSNCAGGLVGISYARYGGYMGLIAIKCVEGSGNAYFGTSYAVGASCGTLGRYITEEQTGASSYNDLSSGVIKLTSTIARRANLCQGFSQDSDGNAVVGRSDGVSYGHVWGEWEIESSAGCSDDGKKVVKCLICGKTLRTETSYAHGHYYLDSACVYCGQADPSQTGSVFKGEANIAVILVGLVIIAGASVLIIKRKKMK